MLDELHAPQAGVAVITPLYQTTCDPPPPHVLQAFNKGSLQGRCKALLDELMAAVPRDPQMSKEMQRRKATAETPAEPGASAAAGSSRDRTAGTPVADEMQQQLQPQLQTELEQQVDEQRQEQQQLRSCPRVTTAGLGLGAAPSLQLAAPPPTTPHAADSSPGNAHPALSGEATRGDMVHGGAGAGSPAVRRGTAPSAGPTAQGPTELSLPAAPPPIAIRRRSASLLLGLQPVAPDTGGDAPTPATANAVAGGRGDGSDREALGGTAVRGLEHAQQLMHQAADADGVWTAAKADDTSAWYSEHVLPWPSIRNMPIAAHPQVLEPWCLFMICAVKRNPTSDTCSRTRSRQQRAPVMNAIGI